MSADFITVEQAVLRYCVRYDRLSQLIQEAFHDSNATEINLYIDLYGIYRTLRSRSYRTVVNDQAEFTSAVINMCAHYRGFFKHYGVYAHIFLISSNNLPEDSLRLYPNYNKEYVEKMWNNVVGDMLDFNIGLLDILCPFIPNVHFLQTDRESAVLIDAILQRERPIPSIILSTDTYPLQLCAHYDNLVFLYPKKYFENDVSTITLPRNASEASKSIWRVILQKNGKIIKSEDLYRVSPSNLMLVQSMNRYSERNIGPTLYNLGYIARKLVQANGHNIRLNPDTVRSVSPGTIRDTDIEEVKLRYRLLHIGIQRVLFQESPQSKMIHYENLEDPDAVNLINSKYFSNNPIDILRL